MTDATDPVILYGLPHSLYSGKARSYLRKQGIAYRERPPSDPRFLGRIMPRVGRVVIPVVETSDGIVVQDTIDIIDHFEAGGVRLPAYPDDPILLAVAHAIELYAVAGLVRHAMHYRWNHLDRQGLFMKRAFATGMDPSTAAAIMDKMAAYLPILGVNDDTVAPIETSFLRLLKALDAHFLRWPYLLGARPSIADYALFGPLYAHLGRDPVPLGIMQTEAPAVFRWVERMNAPDLDLIDFDDSDFPPGAFAEAVPETMGAVLVQAARELQPDLAAFRAFLDRLRRNGSIEQGAPCLSAEDARVLGVVKSSFGGQPTSLAVQPYVLFVWQRLIKAAAASPATGKALRAHGFDASTTDALPASIERRDYREYWA